MLKEATEKTTSIKLHTDWIKRLDDLAALGDLSRHHLMKNMIDVSLDEFTTLRALGFFKVGMALRDLQTRFWKPHVWRTTGDEKSIPITLSEDELSTIDRYAEECDLTRSQFMRNLIYLGIEELEFFKGIGFFKLNDAYNRISDTIKGIINDGQRALKAVET